MSTRDTSARCQNNFQDLANATLPDNRQVLPLRRLYWQLKRFVYHVAALGFLEGSSRALASTRVGTLLSGSSNKRVDSPNGNRLALHLNPGDWVRIRSAREIYTTLDKKGKLNGLAFNQEQAKFCGKQFKVYKRLDKIIVESTGELRRIKTPTVLLEGVFCDGSAHGGCDRSCFCFWREAWLEKVSAKSGA